MKLPIAFLTVGAISSLLIFMIAPIHIGWQHVVSFALGGLCLFLDMQK